MSTTTETLSTPSATPSAPEITVLTRVASIPMIHSGLETLNGTLSTNSYTRSAYTAAKEFSTAAYKLSEPVQIKLAPLIASADGYANKAVDVVESRYPYPFKATPGDVVELVRERKQTASDFVNVRIDENIKSPAFAVAHDLDQRIAPLVDYFEKTVSSLMHSEPGPSSPDTKYQYQRALALSRTLKDSVYEYSTEQLKHIQAQSVIIQRATETAQSINSLATESVSSAQARVHALSESMLGELQKLQTQTSTLAASIQNTINSSKSQIQTQLGPQIQQTYSEISSALTHAITDLSDILKKDVPIQEKVGLVRDEVRERVGPFLETVKKGVTDVLSRSKDIAEEAPVGETKASTPEEVSPAAEAQPTEEPPKENGDAPKPAATD
ncbi:hypothetical protein FA15DRAFT_664777 [Coprinopsis marcescibilis]|uniref:Lipid droplet-associated perilipin protein n=1 Tax=Coprinopsis marcescibilis TaxID=230819 RepID=A0A5C3L7L1_COPMA|nr:hypothetical protein FA15DRAFT_664777 [Coprinopsis marcescibilis]